MPRVPTLLCSDCRRRFGGDETLKRHRVLAGDRFRCLSDQELKDRNYYYRYPAWHRGASLFGDALPGLVDAGRNDAHPELVPTPVKHLARATDPETSRLSAEAIAPKTGTLKAVLLAAYRAEPEGLTRDEVAARTGLDPWQVSKRVSDLLNDGLIVKVSERPGRLGKPVMVCRAKVEDVAS